TVVCILPVADCVEADRCATAKLSMRAANTGIDDVDVHARAGVRIRVHMIQWQIPLSDSIKSPWRIVLRNACLNDRVFLDELDPRISAQVYSLFFGHLY